MFIERAPSRLSQKVQAKFTSANLVHTTTLRVSLDQDLHMIVLVVYQRLETLLFYLVHLDLLGDHALRMHASYKMSETSDIYKLEW